MNTPTTWIAVFDGARARFFSKAGRRGRLDELEQYAIEGERAPSRELGASPPPRVQNTAGGRRHSIEPKKDLHDAAETEFIESVAAFLDLQRAEAAFERLIVIAAPRALGIFRAAAAKSLHKAIAGEVSKDLTKSSAAKVDELVLDEGLV